MSRSPGLACSVLAATALALAAAASADMKQVPVVRLHASTEVAAPPAAVWAQLTQGKNLVTWCPVWKNARNAAVNVSKVGDVLDYRDDWGNGGQSVVTYLAKDRELRVAHEPTRGDYMCQAKLVLSPTAKGTKVDYWEQYTDESSATDLQATAGKMQTGMDQTLASLKSGAEAKKK